MAKAVQLIDKNNNKCYAAPYWPIGSIYISVVNTNPSQWFGGVWESFGSGRVLVGVDTSQTEFNTVMKTGGSKYLQKHTHSTATVYPFSFGGMRTAVANSSAADRTGTAYDVVDSAGQGNAQNLQPYITVYMWRRTA